MKYSSFFLLLVFAIPMILPGCASRETPEDKTVVVLEGKSALVSKEKSVNGGYSATSMDSKNVKEAFIFLKNELSYSYPEFYNIEIQRAEIQIVAGWKIKLFCEYNIGDSKELNLFQAIVYKDTDQNKTLEYLGINK